MPPRDCHGHCCPRNKKREQNKKDKTMRIKLCGLVACAAMLVAGLVSCQQEEIPQSLQYPILFGYSDTRATATIADLKTNGFKVYAYFEGNAGNGATFEKKVTYDEDVKVWGYEGLEYWIPGVEYWFKAFYPSVPSAGTLTVANTDKNQDFTITGFDITKQEDIMVASATARVEAGASAPTNGSVVDLNFQHLLANVTINVLCELGSGVTVERVELRNVTTTGNYNGGWSATTKGSFGFNSNISVNKANNDTDSVDITNGGILVIPEQINGSQKVYVNTSFKEYEIEFPTKYSWNSGQKYSYTLVVKQENIEFNEPKVEIWDEENATGSVVIK